MKYYTALGSALALCTALIGSANAATAQFSSQLDLTNIQYPLDINGTQGNAAADIIRFDLGSGWNGDMEFLLTTGNYNNFTTSLGIALTTDPNDALFNNPGAFLDLVDPTASVTDFFNDNVIGWEFYSWGSNNITAGGTTNITDSFNPSLQFDPSENYYAFIAGGSVIPTEVDIDLTVSSVPVPAAVWLFGSGIVGLIGLARRKNNQVVNLQS